MRGAAIGRFGEEFDGDFWAEIGSYPFFRDGQVGSNFVVRATERTALDACADALIAALTALGRDAVEDGI